MPCQCHNAGLPPPHHPHTHTRPHHINIPQTSHLHQPPPPSSSSSSTSLSITTIITIIIQDLPTLDILLRLTLRSILHSSYLPAFSRLPRILLSPIALNPHPSALLPTRCPLSLSLSHPRLKSTNSDPDKYLEEISPLRHTHSLPRTANTLSAEPTVRSTLPSARLLWLS
ncbi:hypothetical protein TWF730_000744 [Orbilia blumenaviensis]|uniref:Uncharacterized protein n=1 Tax=Orbilia blumenaviensis TaxID=1796055 RepID=A0AAV9VMJ5_9PEZI